MHRSQQQSRLVQMAELHPAMSIKPRAFPHNYHLQESLTVQGPPDGLRETFFPQSGATTRWESTP